ncbi:HEPN domain-containing protein [Pseudorhodoferax sp. Leaf267]|uniref:HEPN domain-containing protein n=1 Tax=Pseudorhodoferax sp. Leaf267 TaxID=1736316 RepID=UPI0006F86440|nr:HEPN domain-containing protein [Pseudorhodoferax sp. Leaf267]KQP14116.1 hypothetical protein ASF43_14855 [Pseudorhodoferax sp. Leaf267]
MADPADQSDVARMLLHAAEQDMAACDALSQAPGIGDAMVGIHAQQCVEKALKAVLSRHSVEFRRTHDLALLLDLLHDHGLPPPPGADWLDELNPYAVDARYGLPGIQGLDRPRVLQALAALLLWAHAQLAHTP